jgi:outer membrane protein OmpA-like peptidoglycan-associated protein
VLGFFTLAASVGIGSCVYLGYRVKKKAEQFSETYKKQGFGKTLEELEKTGTPPPSPEPKVEPWTEPPPSQAGPKVPLRVGLTIVTAIATSDGDYESIKRITSVTDSAVTLSQSADVPFQEFVGGPEHFKLTTKRVLSTRTVNRTDLQKSHRYMQIFDEKSPSVIPGTTAISASSAVLEELKLKGQSMFGHEEPDLGGTVTDWHLLTRKEPRPVLIPVLLNDQRVQLPAVHASCPLATGLTDEGKKLALEHNPGVDPNKIRECDFYFLDDPDNPLVLAWEIDPTDIKKLQVIKIALPSEFSSQGAGGNGDSPGGGSGAGGAVGGGAGGGSGVSRGGASTGSTGGGSSGAAGPAEEFPEIKQSLKQTGRAEVYGIYFEFAKATIREESEPVLKEIANVTTQNPSWKLSIGGHTDNIGGDAYNLGLSNNRAAAVKQALVERYHIAADRLTTSGYGASRPKETNETLEGRARNRRVELIRQ